MRQRFVLAAAAVAALAGCSQAERQSSEPLSTVDVSESADMVAPDVDPAAAPGVAFTYFMALGVPDRRISALQEKHADVCEELGLSQCQIVGMDYRVLDEDRVEGSMRFLLAPQVARGFARQAVSEAEKVDGRLLESRFAGEEVQSGIDQSRERTTTLQARIVAIKRELQGKIADARRSDLNRELADLRQQFVEERQGRESRQKRLNLSPLDIRYAGASVYADAPLAQVAADAGRAGKGSLTLLFTAVIYLMTVVLPWLIALALLFALLRWVNRKTKAWRLSRDHPERQED